MVWPDSVWPFESKGDQRPNWPITDWPFAAWRCPEGNWPITNWPIWIETTLGSDGAKEVGRDFEIGDVGIQPRPARANSLTTRAEIRWRYHSSVPKRRPAGRLLVVSPDTDADGLPEVCESAHGLNPNSPADAALDSDGDGFTNAQEFAANTDPQDAASALRITDAQPSGADLVISFSSAPGKLYRVERSLVSPVVAWNVVADNIAGTGANVQVTDAGGNLNSSCFYQVIVLPQA